MIQSVILIQYIDLTSIVKCMSWLFVFEGMSNCKDPAVCLEINAL